MDGEHEEHEHGAHSRVITAVSYNAGQITYLSYGWQTDRSTVHETEVATATLGTAATVAQSLAAQGYIVAASGSDQAADGSGVRMVGTRVQWASNMSAVCHKPGHA
jgi:hypothetical protein